MIIGQGFNGTRRLPYSPVIVSPTDELQSLCDTQTLSRSRSSVVGEAGVYLLPSIKAMGESAFKAIRDSALEKIFRLELARFRLSTDGIDVREHGPRFFKIESRDELWTAPTSSALSAIPRVISPFLWEFRAVVSDRFCSVIIIRPRPDFIAWLARILERKNLTVERVYFAEEDLVFAIPSLDKVATETEIAREIESLKPLLVGPCTCQYGASEHDFPKTTDSAFFDSLFDLEVRRNVHRL